MKTKKTEFSLLIYCLTEVINYYQIALSYQDITKLLYYFQKECNFPLGLCFITYDCCLDLDYYLARAFILKLLGKFRSFNGKTFDDMYDIGIKKLSHSFSDEVTLDYKAISSLLGGIKKL